MAATAAAFMALMATLVLMVTGRPDLAPRGDEMKQIEKTIDSQPAEGEQPLVLRKAVQCLVMFEVVYPEEDGELLPYPLCSSRCPGNEKLWLDGVAYKRLPDLEAYNLMVETTVKNGTLQSCRMVPYESENESTARQEANNRCKDSYLSPEHETRDQVEVSDHTERIPSPGSLLPIHQRLEGFTRVGDSYYMAAVELMTWQSGVEYCESLGATMALIESSQEQDYLAGVLSTDVWMGVSDIGREGHFVNLENNVVRYSKWSRDEPNNYDDTENCVMLRKKMRFEWNDLHCQGLVRVLCEHPLVDDPHQYRCPNNYLQHKSSCYRISETAGTYAQGENFCTSIGAYPAFINTNEEFDFLKGEIKNDVYIGVTDLTSEGIFTSKKFGVALLTSWGHSQPDDSFSNEDCVMLLGEFNYHWNDIQCIDNMRVLCEVLAEIV